MELAIFKLFIEAEKAGNARLRRNADASIVWDGKHCLFIDDTCAAQDLQAFTKANSEEFASLGILKCYYESDNARLAIKSLSGAYDLKNYRRVFFEGCDMKKIGKSDHRVVSTASLLDDPREYANRAALQDEIIGTWGDLAHFKERGFGVCALDGASISGWCLSEYNNERSCGIGIETIDGYQGRGIGKAMVSGFLIACKARGLLPVWDSWIWNEASIKLAEHAGFARKEEYPAFVLKKKEARV